MPSVLDILRPSVVTGIMNELPTPYDRFQDFFGMGPKGPNCINSETRNVNVDIVNDDATVSQFTAPGDDAAVLAPMAIGTRPVTAPRTFERMALDYERLNNIRSIGKGASELDKSGMSYMKQQGGYMVRRTRRWREFLIWIAMRGSGQFLISGTDWIPVLSGGTVTLDWQVPSDHKNQLGGIITTSWDSAGAEIITNLGDMSAFQESECGMPIAHAWCNTSRWVKILSNSQVRNLGGAMNSPFEIFQATGKVVPNGGGEGTSIRSTQNEARGVLRGWPNLIWHITDRVINLNGTRTKYLGNDEVLFHPEPSEEWLYMHEVKESTNQNANAPPVDVYGYASWIKYPVDADTPKYLLFSLDNAIPCMNPKAVLFADVTP